MLKMNPVTIETADETAAPILEGFKAQYGMVPNFFGALGIDGAALRGYLAFEEAIQNVAHLTPREREMISLAVANSNGCRYCVSGHTFSGKKLGMTAEDCVAAQRGDATDVTEQAVLDLSKRLMAQRGHLESADFALAAQAGISDKKLIQICAWVAINSFSNWVNNIVQPKIDFPKIPLQTGV